MEWQKERKRKDNQKPRTTSGSNLAKHFSSRWELQRSTLAIKRVRVSGYASQIDVDLPNVSVTMWLRAFAGRVRLYSESQVYTVSRWQEAEPQDGALVEENGGTGDGLPFRGRSQSAPAALWKAKKYGRQLRRMSDEFDTWLDKGVSLLYSTLNAFLFDRL